MFHRDRVSATQDHGPLEDVDELEHVRGPVIAGEDTADIWRETKRVAIVPGGEPGEDVLGEVEEVLAALSQRGQRDRDHVQPEEEIVAEPSIGDLASEVAMC